METYDFVMIAVLLGATLFGAWKGLAWQLASMASIFVSYMVAVQFRDAVAPMIKAAPPWNMFLAMLILYVGSSLAIWIAFRFVSAFINRVKLKEFDRHFGALFGLAKGVLLCVIITLFSVTLLGDAQKQSVVNSYSGYYIARLLDKADGVMPEELHEVLGPYIHRLDEELVPGAGGLIQHAATPSGMDSQPGNEPAYDGSLPPSGPPYNDPVNNPINGPLNGAYNGTYNGAANEAWPPPTDRRAEQGVVPADGGFYRDYR